MGVSAAPTSTAGATALACAALPARTAASTLATGALALEAVGADVAERGEGHIDADRSSGCDAGKCPSPQWVGIA